MAETGLVWVAVHSRWPQSAWMGAEVVGPALGIPVRLWASNDGFWSFVDRGCDRVVGAGSADSHVKAQHAAERSFWGWVNEVYDGS